MSLKVILFLCLSVVAMITVFAFYFWWVGNELDKDEAQDTHLDKDSKEIR